MRHRIIDFGLFAAAGCLFAIVAVTPVFPQQTAERDLRVEMNPERRLALLIGNDAYPKWPLRNAVNDAKAMGKALDDLGFTTNVLLNADRRRMDVEIDKFVSGLKNGDAVVLYYAGHGLQIEGENYLVPVDFEGRDEADAKYLTYSASRLHEKLESSGARLKVIVLDACRNNPFRSTRSGVAGLAQMNASSGAGTFIAFATAPGRVANDNPSAGNGLFTLHLVQALRQPGLTLGGVFDKVRDEVYRASAKTQLPWVGSSVIGEFYFNRAKPVEPVVAVRPPEPSPELVYWQSVKDSKTPGLYESYLKRYPTGQFADLARVMLASLRTVEPPPRAVPTAVPGESKFVMNAKDRQEYVWIPPGKFTMGCVETDKNCEDDEKPSHPVTISKGFWLGRNEVTVGAFRRYSTLTKKKMPPDTRLNPKWIHSDHPITRVSWAEAQEFCASAGGRLPTEAEWEYAARSGSDGKLYPWGDEITRDRANFSGTGGNDIFEETAPTRSFDANAWGLYDIAGNVWEWVADWHGVYATDGATDPTGPAAGKERVIRGGSWYSAEKHLRASMRRRGDPEKGANHYGFRCVVASLP